MNDSLPPPSIRCRSTLASIQLPDDDGSAVQGVTTAIAMQHGFGSSLFTVAVCFSVIVMYDAAGVRRHAGARHMLPATSVLRGTCCQLPLCCVAHAASYLCAAWHSCCTLLMPAAGTSFCVLPQPLAVKASHRPQAWYSGDHLCLCSSLAGKPRTVYHHHRCGRMHCGHIFLYSPLRLQSHTVLPPPVQASTPRCSTT
jgi:hypothetical protein